MAYLSYTDVKDAYNKMVKQYKDTADGVSYWEQLLAAPALTKQVSDLQAQTTRDYDISGAFANWKEQQMSLMTKSRLGSGVKSDISQSLENQYESQYAQAQQNYLTSLNKSREEYLKNVETAEEKIGTLSQQSTDVQSKLLEYANLYMGGAYDTGETGIEKMFMSEGEQGYGFYDYDVATQTFTPNQKYYAFVDQILNNTVTKSVDGEIQYSFTDWLAKQKGFEELSSLYKENPKMFATLIGGERASDLEVSPEELAEYKYLDKKYYNKNLTFKNDNDKNEFYSKLDKFYTTGDTNSISTLVDQAGMTWSGSKRSYFENKINKNDDDSTTITYYVSSGSKTTLDTDYLKKLGFKETAGNYTTNYTKTFTPQELSKFLSRQK